MATNPVYGYQKTGSGPVAAGGVMYTRIDGYNNGASYQLETGAEGSGIGAQMMKLAELNPQYEADKAATDVQNKAEAQLGADNRRLSAMGIDPSSGRARAINRNARIALAAAKSGAANKARRAVVRENWDRMYKAAQLHQNDLSRRDRLINAQMQAEARWASSGAGQPTYIQKGRTSWERKGMTRDQWQNMRAPNRVGGRMGTVFERSTTKGFGGDTRAYDKPVMVGGKVVRDVDGNPITERVAGTGIFRKTGRKAAAGHFNASGGVRVTGHSSDEYGQVTRRTREGASNLSSLGIPSNRWKVYDDSKGSYQDAFYN